MTKTQGEGVYAGGVYFFGICTFLGLWIYSMTSWGLLIGLFIGWLPAAIGGLVVGFLWPLFLGLGILLFLALIAFGGG